MAKAENTVIFDGIKYNPGDELPDLKNKIDVFFAV